MADYTYEFVLATGNLTSIERPIDPYTFDEFFDESLFTPKQLRAVKYSFNNKAYHTIEHSIYYECDLKIYIHIDACFGDEYFDSEEEFRSCNDIAWNSRHEAGTERYWDGKRFVKRAENVIENAPMTNKPSVVIEDSAATQEGATQKMDEIINKQLLWEIFVKIPEEAVTNEYLQMAQYKKKWKDDINFLPMRTISITLYLVDWKKGKY